MRKLKSFTNTIKAKEKVDSFHSLSYVLNLIKHTSTKVSFCYML